MIIRRHASVYALRLDWDHKRECAGFSPVLERPESGDSRLSFFNLIEAHTLRALRTIHGVELGKVRYAMDLAERELGVERLLLDPRLKSSGGSLFLDRYTDLLELTPSQQIAMRAVLDAYLQRVGYDESSLPAEFFPFEHVPENAGERVILITPFVSFGRPIIHRVGISTRAIVQRLDAGESVEDVVNDYGLTQAELEEAVLFETAA